MYFSVWTSHHILFLTPFPLLRCAQSFNCVQLFATPWTVARQAPLPVEFPRKNTGVECLLSYKMKKTCCWHRYHFPTISQFHKNTEKKQESEFQGLISFRPKYGLPTWLSGKSPYNAGDLGSILGSGRSPGLGDGNPLQCSCLEDSVDREACWATVQGVA